MKSIIYLALLAAALSAAPKLNVWEDDSPHHVFLNPDLFFERSQIQSQEHSFRSHTAFVGLNAGYEFLQPNNMYVGLVTLFAKGQAENSSRRLENSYDFASASAQFTIEARIGANVQFDELSLIPFVGLGDYYMEHGNGWERINLNYIPIGFKSEYAFRNVNVGFCGKILCTFYASQEYKNEASNNIRTNFWGYEASLPITWLNESLEVGLEPYYLTLNTVAHQFIVGGKLKLGAMF